MPTKFLCIDDEDQITITPYLELIKDSNPDIEIELIKPEEFGESLNIIKQKQPDGLLLDLRLDKEVSYRGSTLAQEIRTRMVEKEIPSFPIFLWSVDENLKQSYNQDNTAHDLFDIVYIKDDIINTKVADEILDMCSGYKFINKLITENLTDLDRMLGLSGEESELLDPRIGDIFKRGNGTKSVHEYATYIHKEIVLTQGPLIDENVLAARLGVDIKTSEKWGNFLDLLDNPCGYLGAFKNAWPRWWASKVEDWWLSFSEDDTPLRRLNAAERVKVLNEKFEKSGFNQAEPIEESYGTKYWTICRGTKQPLDTMDGLLAMTSELKPWQEPPYLSIKAALERIGRDRGVRIHPLELERLQEIKERES